MTTIEQLERDVWPDLGPGATSLVRRCTKLRRTPTGTEAAGICSG
ncbi:hypothetical protein [Micromonospora sp. NPDC005203]